MWQGSEDRVVQQGDQANPQDEVIKPRYFLLGEIPGGVTVEGRLLLPFAQRNDWKSGIDTFLHDATSLLAADALLLGKGWLDNEYDIALLAVARGCGKRVVDAATMEDSGYAVFPWGKGDWGEGTDY